MHFPEVSSHSSFSTPLTGGATALDLSVNADGVAVVTAFAAPGQPTLVKLKGRIHKLIQDNPNILTFSLGLSTVFAVILIFAKIIAHNLPDHVVALDQLKDDFDFTSLILLACPIFGHILYSTYTELQESWSIQAGNIPIGIPVEVKARRTDVVVEATMTETHAQVNNAGW